MVAKMPLLMSSRMTSAGLTSSSSASSLTVIVDGQLDRATLARVGDLHATSACRRLATRWLAGSASAAGAAPTPGQWCLLRSVSVFGVLVAAGLEIELRTVVRQRHAEGAG